MSSDIRWYLKCKVCGEKIRLARIWKYAIEVEVEHNEVNEFIEEHIWFNNGKCCNYDNYQAAIPEVGFEIIRENDEGKN